MLVLHLFVSYANVNLCPVSLPPGIRGWLRRLLVALPGPFCLPFFLEFSNYSLNPFIAISR